MSKENVVRIIVLGESGVGKTSLLLRFAKGIFKVETANTTVDCITIQHEIDGQTIKLELWDTAGQDRFKAIIRNFFRKADGVLLVYDVTDITTFLKLSSWLAELRQLNETATAIIVGNKKDEADTKSVALSSVREFANQEGMDFFEASAKRNDNVKHIFECLTRKVINSRNNPLPVRPAPLPPASLNPDEQTDSPPTEAPSVPLPSTRTESQETDSSSNSWDLVLRVLPVLRVPEDVIKLDESVRNRKKKKSCC